MFVLCIFICVDRVRSLLDSALRRRNFFFSLLLFHYIEADRCLRYFGPLLLHINVHLNTLRYVHHKRRKCCGLITISTEAPSRHIILVFRRKRNNFSFSFLIVTKSQNRMRSVQYIFSYLECSVHLLACCARNRSWWATEISSWHRQNTIVKTIMWRLMIFFLLLF